MLSLLLFGLMTASPMSRTQASRCDRIVCYFSSWAQYRPGIGRFTPDNIDPSLCTHLIYAFAKLSGNNLTVGEWNDDSVEGNVGMFEKVVNMKKRNPSLNVLLAVGGWNPGSEQFTQMVQTSSSRQQFITQNIQFLRERGFDGLDLNWQYPANRGSPPDDKDRFTSLVMELQLAFVKEAAKTGKSRLLLSAAVSAIQNIIDTAYDVRILSKQLDFINIMTYDMHGYWENVTGHHSPLYARLDETGDQHKRNIDWAAKYWVKQGALKSKLNIGLALYGRSFTLDDPDNYQLGAPASAPGQAGQYTKEPGFLAYYEVCDLINEGGKVEFNVAHKESLVLLGNQWVSYDNADSFLPKVRYIMRNKFGGVMIWAIDLDDFDGSHCMHGQYPMMRSIAKECKIIVKVRRIPIIQDPKEKKTEQPQTQSPANTTNDAFCLKREDGKYADPSDCANYIMCSNEQSYKMECSNGTAWNDGIKACDQVTNTSCDHTAHRKPEK